MPPQATQPAPSPDRAGRWAASAEGQARIQEALTASDRKVSELRAARQLDPEVLKLPITV